MSYGILVSCYVAISATQFGWVKGYETQQLKAGEQLQERAVFEPLDMSMPAMEVDTNNCQYLEDPVKAYQKMIANKPDRRVVGKEKYCLVDEYGRKRCHYKSMAECLPYQTKLQTCEPREAND